MLRFELKKVFSKFKNRMAIIILFVALILTTLLTINKVEYLDQDGYSSVGISAARNLRTEKNKWSGLLTEDVLLKAAEENKAINNSKEALSDDIEEQDKAYAKKQGISCIVDMINNAYSGWRDYDYYAIDNLSSDEIRNVYQRRISGLKEWIDSGEEDFTDAEKKYLISQYEKLKTPFRYEYIDGWSVLLQNIPTFMLILALIIGFLVSGVFSDEFMTKADSIFFSARYGRNKAVASKIRAGFLIVTLLYGIFIILYTVIVLFVLGMDGANCPIQLDLWRSVYNITFFQAYLLIVVGGYIGTLFSSMLSMIVSAASHSTAIAIIVPFIILCAFPFLSRIITLPYVCSFFPDKLMEIYISIKDFELVKIGGKIMDTGTVIIPVYIIVCVILFPLLYHIFKRAEVK